MNPHAIRSITPNMINNKHIYDSNDPNRYRAIVGYIRRTIKLRMTFVSISDNIHHYDRYRIIADYDDYCRNQHNLALYRSRSIDNIKNTNNCYEN